MTIYAAIDTNVLVSSLITKNRSASTVRILDAVADGDIVPLYCAEILAEYHEVLRRPKFCFSEPAVRRLLDVIQRLGVSVDPTPTGEMLVDMDDLVFLRGRDGETG